MRCHFISILVLTFGLAAAHSARAQSHFSTCLSGSGNIFNATVFVPADSNPNVNGAPLSAGSEIAVIASDPENEDQCVGVLTWQGKNGAITVWGDDVMTASRDGMLDGEKLSYKIWDRGTDSEYGPNSITVKYETGFSTYSHDAVFVLEDMTAWGAPIDPDGPQNDIQLFHNYPNPFRAETTITYRLDKTLHTTLKIYDLLGKEIAVLQSLIRPAGIYQVKWVPNGLASGTYICKLEAGGVTRSRTISLIN